jgi:polyhydroxybutyrate depolymerase
MAARRHQQRRRRTTVEVAVVLLALVGLGLGFASTRGGATTSDPPAPAVPPATGRTVVDRSNVTGRGMPTGSASLADVREAAPGTRVTVRTVVVGGDLRGSLVVAPARQAGRLPLIVVTHGVHESAAAESLRDEFLPLVTQGKAVLLYPAGYEESWNTGVDGCCGPAASAGLDDVGFVTAAVRDALAHLPVDPARTYLVGFSNGGKLAYEVQCRAPQLFAGLVGVAAVPLSTCASKLASSVPVLISIGTADPELPIKGHTEPPLTALAGAVSTFRERDGCSAATSATTVDTATITTYGDCRAGAAIETVTYAKLAHLWPTAARVGSAASAARLVWAFLSAA